MESKSICMSPLVVQREGEGGSILVPCLFILSLISLLTLGVLNIGGIGVDASDALAERSQAHLAALSGVEIAYKNLAEDVNYGGETRTPFEDPDWTVEIVVNDLGNREYEVLSCGTVGESDCLIRTRASVTPWETDAPLTVGKDLDCRGSSKILGDCKVNGNVTGNKTAFITGDLYLPGDRNVQYDGDGTPVSIDGNFIPMIGGELVLNAPPSEFPTLVFDDLRTKAVEAGQLYQGNKFISETDLEGVVYFEGEGARIHLRNVTIKGVLVSDGAEFVNVPPEDFLKIKCDDTVCPKVAILAPNTSLDIQNMARVEITGMSFVGSSNFHGSGTFTGPLVIKDDLFAFPTTSLCLQYPSSMRIDTATEQVWTDYRVVELEYEEQ